MSQSKEYHHQYYLKNKEKQLKQSRDRYLRNKDKLLERMKEYKKNHPEETKIWNRNYKQRHRAKIRLRRYGLSIDQYEKLKKDQNYKCAICQRSFDFNSKIYVDHDHKTGKIRGLLCQLCNSMLGFAGDNSVVLSNAIRYLEASKEE